MSNFSLVGRCGLYCGACTIYRAERDSHEWRSKLAANFNCSTEQVRCNGCGSLTSECWGSGCKIVMCLNARGNEFCYQCDDYKDNNCSKFLNLAEDYSADNVDLRANLRMIQNGEIEKWLEQSEKKFICKSCRKPTVVGSKKCHHCHLEL